MMRCLIVLNRVFPLYGRAEGACLLPFGILHHLFFEAQTNPYGSASFLFSFLNFLPLGFMSDS